MAAIRQIFADTGATRISSQQLAVALSALSHQSTNPGIHKSRPRYTPVTLSRRLRQFGIKPKVMRFGDHLAKGYDLADFPPTEPDTEPRP